MPAFTTNLNLYKPGGGSTGTVVPDEVADIDRLNGNFDLIDAAFGALPSGSVAGEFTSRVEPDSVLITTFGTGASSTDLRVWKIGKTGFLSGTLSFSALMNYNDLFTVPTGFRPTVGVSMGNFVFGATSSLVYGDLDMITNGKVRVTRISSPPSATGQMNVNAHWRIS